MSPMFKQKVGMTKIYAKGIAELFLIRCNPYHWDGSGEVPDNISFDVYKRKIDETYDGCTLEIQLCKPDGCLCYAASVHLYEGGFWTGHGIGCFDKTAICNDPGSVDALTSAIMRVCILCFKISKLSKPSAKNTPLERGFGLSKWMTSRHHLLAQKVRLLVLMIQAASSCTGTMVHI